MQNKRPLYIYVIGVAVVWAILLCIVWFQYASHFAGALSLCAMFLLGMLAMYIAVHLYKWK
jgi:hypothetical protein